MKTKLLFLPACLLAAFLLSGFPGRAFAQEAPPALRPRVARPALPWEPIPRIYQPHRGCGPVAARSWSNAPRGPAEPRCGSS